ncbi:MAG: 2-C-methyl-D-erythritol 2,4-cyclodiphosphate synthase [Chloroflexota bacterium]
MRIGQGIDIHAFAEARPLILGGVAIPHPRGLAGHSDGDALLHAIIDALLGAAALGDIGGMFPSSDEQWRDASSVDLLRLVRERVSATGLRIANIDATVIAQEPRLGGYIGAMRDAVATALEVDVTAISLKATTSDGLGFTGRGDGIAALAVVLLE